MDSVYLTRNEEKLILDQIVDTHMDFIGNGAARLVFRASQDICDKYCNGHAAVIKVAVGQGGMTQNQNEINCYLEHGARLSLATIYAYGTLIEIMQAVDPVECRDFLDYEDEPEAFNEMLTEDYGYEFSDETAYEFLQVAYSLCDVFGYTADNGQLGIDENGCIVAYDYGFMDDGDVQTSDLTDMLENYEQDRLNYIHSLAEALKNFDTVVSQAVCNLESNMLYD